MADAGGFEPPTARFVAEYSIQLSYASIGYFYPAIVLYLSGGRRRIRTSDRSVRSRVLYPAELCVHWVFLSGNRFVFKWRTQEDSNLRPLGS